MKEEFRVVKYKNNYYGVESRKHFDKDICPSSGEWKPYIRPIRTLKDAIANFTEAKEIELKKYEKETQWEVIEEIKVMEDGK